MFKFVPHIFLAVIFLQPLKIFAESREVCGQRPVDVIFLLDGSRSVRPGNFRIVKNYVKNFTYIFDHIGSSGAQIGVIQFGSSIREEIRLNEYNSRDELFEAIDNIHYMEMGTMTGEALKYLVTIALNQTHGSRLGQTDVHTVAVVITDGKSQDYHRGTLTKWQNEGKKLGIEFYAIGVGKRYNEKELLEIASSPKSDHTYHASDFSGIRSIALQLQDLELCGLSFPSPKNLQFTNISHTSVTVRWKMPDEVNSTLVDHYILSYKKLGDNEAIEDLEVNGSNSVILSHLEPSTTYNVFVSAVAQNRSSKSTPIYRKFTTLFVGNTNVTLSNPTLTTLSAHWNVAGGDRLTGYKLSLAAGDSIIETNKASENAKARLQYFEANVTSTVLRGLEPNTTYTVRVVPVHDGNISGKDNSASRSTDSFIPPDVIISNSTISGISLKWRGSQRYPILYWNISVYDAKTGVLLQNFNCSGNLRYIVLKNLSWSSRCRVSVIGVVVKDGRYFNTPPTILFGKTKPLRPPKVRVTKKTTTQVQVQWFHSYNNVTSWILKIFPKGRRRLVKIAEIPGNRSTHTFDGLFPSTMHKIEVFAKAILSGRLLNSPKGKTRIITKSLQRPNATITSTSTSSITIEWENIKTDVDSWRIRIRDSTNDRWVQVINVKKDQNQTTITNLTPNTSYEIFLCGRIQRQKLIKLSPEDRVFGTTNNVAPLLIKCTNSEKNSITIKWSQVLEATSWNISVQSENEADYQAENFFQTGNKLSYELVGLVPGTTYSIDVRANTARDEDDAVPSATCTCTTKPASPSNLHVEYKGLNRLTMAFDPPVGQFDNYVGYCSSLDNPEMVLAATFTNNKRMHCEGLNHSTIYAIHLSSVCRNMTSAEISTSDFTLVPPPTGLVLSSTTTHSLVATWTAPAAQRVEFYYVTYNTSNNDVDMVVLQGNITTTTLKHLEPDTLYLVRVQGEINELRSSFVESSKKTLSESLDLQIDEVGYTFINVSWTPSSVPHLNSYCLKYTPAYLPNYDDSVLLPPNVLTYSLTDLETATIYKIALNAQYQFKQSDEIEKFASTLALPPVGPINFTEVTDSSFVAHWSPPETDPFPVGYIVTYYTEGRQPISTKGVNATFFLTEMLRASTTYSVTVQACYPDDIISQSIEGQITTLPSVSRDCSCTNYLTTQSKMQEQIEQIINQVDSLNYRFEEFQLRGSKRNNFPKSKKLNSRKTNNM